MSDNQHAPSGGSGRNSSSPPGSTTRVTMLNTAPRRTANRMRLNMEGQAMRNLNRAGAALQKDHPRHSRNHPSEYNGRVPRSCGPSERKVRIRHGRMDDRAFHLTLGKQHVWWAVVGLELIAPGSLLPV